MTRPCWNACPACGGDGLIVTETGIDRTTGALMEQFDRCDYCDGRGEIEETAQPIDCDDIDGIIWPMECSPCP